MRVGIPKESLKFECRVAITPSATEGLRQLGFQVNVERDAGKKADFDNQEYKKFGAIITSKDEIWKSDIIVKINPPTDSEINLMREGSTLVCLIEAIQNPKLLEKLQAKKITTLGLDLIPRISRAQSMDVLSSMANIAGYRAVIEAAFEFGRFFAGQITAAGKIPPAKVLVIGAGVAGLAAISAAKNLGAVVKAFDTREEVKEEIQSLGGEFLEIKIKENGGGADGYAKIMSAEYIKAEMELFATLAKEVDVIITTALIPNKPAPKLITKEMVESMKSGSVIVDLAAINGGNCELTEANKIVNKNGVKILGYTDYPSRLSTQSSQLFATNLLNFFKLLCKEKNGVLNIDFSDEIIRSATAIKESEITFPPPPIKVSAKPKQKPELLKSAPTQQVKKQSCPFIKYALVALALLLCVWLFDGVEETFLAHLSLFALSCVVGYYVIWNVSSALHTPLMSVTNAISGIIIIGALLQLDSGGIVSFFAFIGVFIASINIFGGFVVTQRMLKMFQKGSRGE